MSNLFNPNRKGWNVNTDLCVDLKTFLRSDNRTKRGKTYHGLLRRDTEDHYTFLETAPSTAEKRNPRLFDGKYITITRKDDGTLRPNFKPMKMEAGFSVDSYAFGVANELMWALEGLIGE